MSYNGTSYYYSSGETTASGTITPEIAMKLALKRTVEPMLIRILKRELGIE